MPKYSALRILIADDQGSMLQLVRATLGQLGCTDVIACSDGMEALNRLSAQSVDLIISDLNMPKLDGLGLLRAVRREAALQNTPFMLLTARGEEKPIKEAVALGVDGYLMKPFSVVALKNRMEAVVGPSQ